MSLELQNYLTVADFDKFIEALYNLNFNRAPMTAKGFEMLYSCAFFCALRISEALNLRTEDFNLNRNILTLPITKTGFKHCSCSKWKKNKLLEVDTNCNECQGRGKVRVPQKTTIPPPFIEPLREFLIPQHSKIFVCSRQTAWRYAKLIGHLANLDIFDIIGKGKEIEGIYTHLFRKSYAKFMEEKGASPSLINLKGRWKPKEQYLTYTKPSLISLINWEAKAWSKN